MIDNEIKENLKQTNSWTRGLYMLMFAVFYSIAEVVMVATVIFQFLLLIFTAKPNERLVKLGQSLSTYQYQIMIFLTFNSEVHPYPFGAWPKGEPTLKKNRKAIEDKAEAADKTEDASTEQKPE